MNKMELDIANMPDTQVDVRKVFGIDVDMEVPAYSDADAYVPDIDPDYIFDRATTLAILAGFAHNRRVMVSGYHGTGKSTHIEQVIGVEVRHIGVALLVGRNRDVRINAEYIAHLDGRVRQIGDVEVDLAHHVSKAWLGKPAGRLSCPILL